MKRFVIFSLLFLVSSCAVLDYPRRFAGFSIQKFENEETGRHEKIVEMSKTEAFNKTLKIIKEWHARVTFKSCRKDFIVAFDFSKKFDYCLDSTETAFFFDEIDEKNLKISVVSNNSLLAKQIASVYFEKLKE